MKIAIVSVQVPFITGGAEILVGMLRDELKKRGHDADIVTIPFKWYPSQAIVDSMMMARLMDITEVNGQKIDMVIAMKFPAYYVEHDNKVFWLMHQHRQAYELWGTEHGDLHKMKDGKEVREAIVRCDNRYIPEGKKVFTISKTTADRLLNYNSIKATPLYHPPLNAEKFRSWGYEDYIFYPSRIDSIKRQILLIKALKYCTTPVKVVLAGSSDPRALSEIMSVLAKDGTTRRVEFKGFISESEKIDLYSRCLGVYFGAYQEDYGYVTLEAFFSEKPVITHLDSGGPLEFVDDTSGYILPPDPEKIAGALDELYENKARAAEMGMRGRQRMDKLNISWDHVIKSLLA